MGVLFSCLFLLRPLFTKKSIFCQNLHPNGSPVCHFWLTFWRLAGLVEIDAPLKRKSTFWRYGVSISGTFSSLCCRSWFDVSFLRIFMDMCRKWPPKGIKIGCPYFGQSHLGASCGTFGAPVCFLTRKVQPKCSKSDPKAAKLTPKGIPKW